MIQHSSLSEMIGQTQVKLVSKGSSPCDNVGGIFVGAQVITSVKDNDTVHTVAQTIQEYQQASSTPLVVLADFENGCGSVINGLTILPYLMSLGATNDESLAYDYGASTALDASRVGINWSCAPVCDLNFNARNPLINCRAISDDEQLAARLLKQVIKGMQDNGLAACAKHFPGDGVDWRDQHITLTANSFDMKKWYETFGYVYKQLKDAYSVMVGHIALPAYDDSGLPATLSHRIVTDLLKGELEYKGVAITDALGMGGYLGYYGSQAKREVESFKAGFDMFLWPQADFVQNIENAVENSYISKQRVTQAYERVMQLKQNLGLFDGIRLKTLSAQDKKLINDTRRLVAEKSITLVKDKKNILPIKKESKIAIVTVSHYEPSYDVVEDMKKQLESNGTQVERFNTKAEVRELAKRTDDFDYIIYALMTRPFRPQGPVDFMDKEASKLWAGMDFPDEKLIIASFGSPYFGTQYFERQSCYINAYSMLSSSVKAFAKAITGEIEFTDFSPVKI